jgi:antitoxin HicB
MSWIEAARYSMVIEWSDEGQAYIVTLPEWEAAHYMGHVHGRTRAEALAQGEKLLNSWLEYVHQEGEPLPAPRIFAGAGV